MYLTETIAARFPLVARPRPVCTPLPQRVAAIGELASAAARTNNTASATAVFNLAALLASDCGLPDLSREWCHRLARICLSRQPQDAQQAIHSLEPIVNLARLRTRANDGVTAWSILEDLYRAVATHTDVTIDGIDIPAATLNLSQDQHREVCTWLWATLLSTGARGLAAASQWEQARQHLHRHNGIGHRMLDGRQIAVISHAINGNMLEAQSLLRSTSVGEPWESAVTAVLALFAEVVPLDHLGRRGALDAYQAFQTAPSGLAVFQTRLGLTLVDGLGADEGPARVIAQNLLRLAVIDGYAARDVLTHPIAESVATAAELDQLINLVQSCGLDAGTVPDHVLAELPTSLDTAQSVLTMP
jgi:hypothetical protein